MSISIENELVKFRQSAEEGYNMAKREFDDIKQTLIEAAQTLDKTDTEQNRMWRIRNTELIDKQKQELRRVVDEVSPIGNELQKLRERSKDFSIVVYGRTMAGKSTLMEILTHGNGKSIGKGAQRTTQDVRSYYWKGLKITDVPGISAFGQGGAADEKLAFEAAKAADLIIFLLTNNAPEADEAEKLAQLRNLGKPVLGIINIKMSCNINDELDIEDLQERLADTETINVIIEQFKKFSVKHNQDWSEIKFVPTHLLSAYQAQGKNPKVFKISRFNEVEDFILEKVRADGRFLRIKTFVDTVAVPMNNIILKIYAQAAESLLESDIYCNKWRQLEDWRENFMARSQERLKNLYNTLDAELGREISDFVDNHYEDGKAGENWQSRFNYLNFDGRYRRLLKDLADECQRKRKELSDNLTKELSYTFSGNMQTNIKMGGTTTWGKYGAGVLGGVGGFILARGAGVVFPPLGIALTAIGILGAIFGDSKEDKIRKNKNELRKAINPPSYQALGKMHDQAVDTFNNEILAKGVDELNNLLTGYQFMLARLGESQSAMASALFKEYSDLNYNLLLEAIDYKNAGFVKNVESIARIPGETVVVIAERCRLNTKELSALLGESVITMTAEEDITKTLKFILNRDFDVDSYPLDYTKENQKTEEAVAILLKDSVYAKDFKIAQQIAGVPIIRKKDFTPPRITKM